MAYEDFKKARKSAQRSVGKVALEKAGSELKKNPPRILAKTRKKKGASAANKQRIAIMFSKARKGNY